MRVDRAQLRVRSALLVLEHKEKLEQANLKLMKKLAVDNAGYLQENDAFRVILRAEGYEA